MNQTNGLEEKRKRVLRALFAVANDLFERDVVEYLLRAYSIVNYGKDSLKKLSAEEIEKLIKWIDSLGEQ